ncbi:hypothetical protein [Staphylococcus hominis]|uniref:hypothetical protein n=1 Tax=Staphylococcus hominis TaxID=1290 RepID=UPI003BF5DBA9
MAKTNKEKILEYIKNNHLDYDGVFGELVDASKSSVDLRWQLILDFYSPLQTHTSKVMSKEEMLIHELFKQCKSFKKQRDELINDMAEIKRKAEAFDEILDINIDKDELLSEEYIEKVNDVIQEWKFS